MSPGDSNKWTSITIRRSLFNRLETFCETYDISGKGEAIDTLFAISHAAGVPESPSDRTSKTMELDIDSITDIQGFLIGKPGGRSELVGVDGTRATLIGNVIEASASIQPLLRTKITNGTVVCPACGSELMDYELSESFPGVKNGVFKSLNIGCDECESSRPHYTLFVAEPGVSPPADAIKGPALSFLAYVLILEPLTPDEFEERVTACSELALDGGWEWLPDPSTWLGFEIEEVNAGPVTPDLYADFIKNYVRVLTETTTDARIMNLETSPPSETSEYFDDCWQIHMETRESDPRKALTNLEEETGAWATVEIDIEEIDAETFADYTYVVSLRGLETANSSV